MAKRKPVPPLASSSAGTFKAPPQQGQALGKKDYGYWVAQGGSHFVNMGKVDSLEPKSHHEHRSARWAKRR